MDPEKLEEFFNVSELLETQKRDIRNSLNKKTNEYIHAIYWHKVHKVRLAVQDLEIYVIRFGIFFPLDIKEKFDEIVGQLKSELIDYELGKESGDFKIRNESWTKLRDSTQPLFHEIESMIRNKLRSHGQQLYSPGD